MKYAYRIYKTVISHPVIGGTVSGESMEDAARKVVRQNGVKVVHESRNGYEYHYFTLRNENVGILLYINPEEF